MPSRTNSSAAAKEQSGSKFELPTLDLQLGSLTDGTDIPPPPPSPKKEVGPTPPHTPSATAENKEKGISGATNGQSKKNGTIITTGTKRPADDIPLSPALSQASRQGSIRRLFSRTVLNNSYAEGEAETNGRPASRSNTSILDEKKAKRSSGWFRRFKSGDPDKRSSSILGDSKRPAGPPPPMIPELSALDAKIDVADDGTLGNDLFKNIR